VKPIWKKVGAFAVVCGLASTIAVACAERERPEDVAHADLPESSVNMSLVAFLSKARAAHHRADLAEKDANPTRAIRALTELVSGKRPALTAEVREVLADSYARLADLVSQQGDFDDADDDVDAGLALATEVTYFRGHLYEIAGLVAERESKALEAKGDTTGASEAAERAANLFEQAIDIQEQVIDKALSTIPPVPPRQTAPNPTVPQRMAPSGSTVPSATP
jgi:hypothetical protein